MKEREEELLDVETIKAAAAGEAWAQKKVIEHYTPLIEELAVDEDMKQHLILRLLEETRKFSVERAAQRNGRLPRRSSEKFEQITSELCDPTGKP